MQKFERSSFQKESDLLKVYRQADARAKYLNDTDEKLLSYHGVVDFCLRSKKCLENESVKKNQILFWTYKHIGDLFLQKNAQMFERSNEINALNSYQKAIEFSKNEDETLNVLLTIRAIYQNLQDQKGMYESSMQMIELLDDAFKIEMLLHLADEAENRKEEIYFLEEALKYATSEKISILKKCKNTFNICTRLLEIYQKAGMKAELARIETVKNEVGKMLLE